MPALLITSLVWAISFGLIGNHLTGMPSDFVSMVRMAGALLVFLPFARKIPAGHALLLAAIGAVQFGAMYLCYTAAFHYLPSWQVAVFTVMTPIYIVLIGGIIHRKLTLRHIAAALLAAGGCAAILWKGWSGTDISGKGFLLVQISNICFAAGQLAYAALKRSIVTQHERSVFAYAYAGALLVTLPTGIPSGSSCWQSITALQWGILAYLGAVASGLCFFLWNYGARRVTPGRLAVMNNLKIPLAALSSLLIFGEHANLSMLITGCLLMSAAFLATHHTPARQAQDKTNPR